MVAQNAEQINWFVEGGLGLAGYHDASLKDVYVLISQH